MEMKKLEQSFSVCQVEDYSLVNLDAEYCFIGKTDEETSLVCAAGDVPQNVIRRDDGWRVCRMSRRGSSCSRSAPSLRCCTSSSRSRQPVSLCCSANSESIKNLRPLVCDPRTEIFDAPTRRAVGQWPAEGLPEYKERAINIATRLAGLKTPRRPARGSTSYQQSWLPAGTESSSITRCSSSLPSTSRTAESSMPLDICPIILRGGRLRMATTVLPTSVSGS